MPAIITGNDPCPAEASKSVGSGSGAEVRRAHIWFYENPLDARRFGFC